MSPLDDTREGTEVAVPLLAPGIAQGVMARLYPPPHPYADDPVGWMRDECGEVTWSMQDRIAESVRDNRYTAVKACHGAGKSFIASRIMAWWADVHGEAAFIVWTAPRNDQVHAIIGEELRDLQRAGKLRGQVNLAGRWTLDNGKLIGQGRKPADHDAHGFQGIHRPRVLVIVDEACGIPANLWNAIDALTTEPEARVLAIGNPTDPTSHFAKVCRPGSGWNVLTINGLHTPQFTEEGKRLPPDVLRRLTSKTWVEERRKRWGTKSPLWFGRVLGEFPEVDDASVFPPNLVVRACNVELPGTERGVVGLDVARMGPDRTVAYRNRGGVSRRVLRHSKLDTEETADRVAEFLSGTPGLPCVIDMGGGYGSGVHDKLKRRGYNVIGFDGAHKSSKPKRFKNKRAEAYWRIRSLMEDDLIDLDEADDALLNQMSQIRFRTDSSDRIVIESKEDMVKRLGKEAGGAGDDTDGGTSPDELDAFVYSFVPVADIARDALDELREGERRRAKARDEQRDTFTDAPLTRAGRIIGDITDVPL